MNVGAVKPSVCRRRPSVWFRGDGPPPWSSKARTGSQIDLSAVVLTGLLRRLRTATIVAAVAVALAALAAAAVWWPHIPH
jgi:hypothetical protein